MTVTPFSNISAFVRTPRLQGLWSSHSGMVVTSRRTTDEDGSAFLDQLFAVHPDGARQLTFGEKSASVQAVGERGELFFGRGDPGAEKSGDALWMLPPTGEARAVFRYRGGIEAVQVSDHNILLTLPVLPRAIKPGQTALDTLAHSADLLKKRGDAKVSAVLHERYPTRYWDQDLGPAESRLFVSPLPPLELAVDLTEAPTDTPQDPETPVEKTPAALSPNELDLTEVALPSPPEGVREWNLTGASLTPDGKLALITMEGRTSIDTFAQVWLLDLSGAIHPRVLVAQEKVDFWVMAISPQSDWAVVARELPPLPGQTALVSPHRVDFASGTMTELSADDATGVVIGDDQRIYLTAHRQGRGGIYLLDDNGERHLLTPDDEYNYENLQWADGQLVALRSSIAEPAAIVIVDPQSGTVTPGPQLTPELELPGELSEVFATAIDGTPLRAWLVTPSGEGPHPLVVFAHGGPWGSWNDWTWRWNAWAFAARGYAVLMPDPGMSTGYGHHMVSRGHDSIGDEPFTDIMALTDAAVARDDIDDSRQLFAGGSYGGYMANWVAGHTGSRFRAIVTHASLWNTESMARTTDNGGWYRWMLGQVNEGPYAGVPQSDLWSPHRFVDEIEVPLLVIHGDRDYRVPISQGLELWMDLQRVSPELEHQFLYYPDEGHWILKPGNAEVWYETFLAFLDRHSSDVPFQGPELLG